MNENSLLYGFLKDNLFIQPKLSKEDIKIKEDLIKSLNSDKPLAPEWLPNKPISVCYFGMSKRGKKTHIINRNSHIPLCADKLKDITEIHDYFTNEKLVGCKKCIQIYNAFYCKERGITDATT